MYKNLKAEMARAGITQQEMARRLGMTPATLSLKLNGKAKFSLSDANLIKTALGVDIPLDELFAVKE